MLKAEKLEKPSLSRFYFVLSLNAPKFHVAVYEPCPGLSGCTLMTKQRGRLLDLVRIQDVMRVDRYHSLDATKLGVRG